MAWLLTTLTTLNLYYLLDTNVQPAPERQDNIPVKVEAQLLREKNKCNTYSTICRRYIPNSLSNHLYEICRCYKMPQVVWITLESKYKHVNISTDRFLALKYIDFKFADNKPITYQV